MKEALSSLSSDHIREKMIRYWKDVRRGLNIEIPAGF
jgi:hypothetical protein